MIRAIFAVIVFALAYPTVPALSAAAPDCRYEQSSQMLNGIIRTQLVLVCPSHTTTGSSSDSSEATNSESDPDRFSGGFISACVGAAIEFQLNVDDFCIGDEPEAVTPAITPARVAAAFRDTELPPSELTIQPPDGRTLVNFPTNFYTQPRPLDRTLTLLGRQVQLRITPTTYTWHFDTTTTRTTTTPGAAYPDLEITHDYLRAGTATPSLDTTYTADYRLTGQPWQPVPGTVTIPGPPTPLEIVEAQPTLVDYR